MTYAQLSGFAMPYTKSEALMEVKDVTKNFLGSDYENGSEVVEKRPKRRGCVTAIAVALGGLAIWMIVQTVVQQVQIAALRREVDELTANMITITANVKSLNQKLENNKFLNEFKTLEDAIYADEDQDNIPVDSKDSPIKEDDNSLEKLEGLTVLEDDDDLGDDEDIYDDDDDDVESGDWYADYDNRRPKVTSPNMVKLKPDDFTGSVVTLGEEKKPVGSIIREIKRMLNENPEIPETALPTLPPAHKRVTEGTTRDKRSVMAESSVHSVDYYAAPRVVSKNDERRKTKKYTHTELPPVNVNLHTVARRNSEGEEGGQKRPFIAAHFYGNTSHLNPEIHSHYKGNGLVRMAHDKAHDVWYPSPWTMSSPHPRPTLTRNGHVHVKHTGVYLVYVQIYYLDSHDVISWVLHRTNPDIEGRETLLQCAQSSHSSDIIDKPNSCFSASALFLKNGDRLAVRNTGGDRHSLMQPEKSFIGLVKLADADDPEEEF